MKPPAECMAEWIHEANKLTGGSATVLPELRDLGIRLIAKWQSEAVRACYDKVNEIFQAECRATGRTDTTDRLRDCLGALSKLEPKEPTR